MTVVDERGLETAMGQLEQEWVKALGQLEQVEGHLLSEDEFKRGHSFLERVRRLTQDLTELKEMNLKIQKGKEVFQFQIDVVA